MLLSDLKQPNTFIHKLTYKERRLFPSSSHSQQVDECQSLSLFLTEWKWQWFCTFTFQEHFGPDRVKKYLLSWTRQLCVSESIQVGYCYILTYHSQMPHLHLLMLGQGKNNGLKKTLADVSRGKWANKWPCYSEIQIPHSISAVSKYAARHQLESKDFTYDFYNLKLLKKLHARDLLPKQSCLPQNRMTRRLI